MGTAVVPQAFQARTGEHSAYRWAAGLGQQIRDWAETATVARCPAELAEDWCDLVIELTVIDSGAGTVQPGLPVAEAMPAHIGTARRGLTAQAEQARLRRAPLGQRRGEVAAELAKVSGTESPPPAPTLWR